MSDSTYLGFFMNRQTKEEFVAPVQADDADAAKWELELAYPISRYQLLTVYSRKEIENVLVGIDRWPGMPSKVQEPVKTDLSRVRASTGGLPPLPGQKPVAKDNVETVMARMPANNPALPAWMQNLVVPQMQAPDQAAAPALEDAMALKQASQPQSLTPGGSLIERLKAARGEMPAMPIRREPVREDETPITRTPGSVIDILKGMRK